MMTELLIMATWTILAGALLGVFFFGGLWWTVQKGLVAKTPALWFLVSYLLRMGVVLSGFVWLAREGGWQHVSMALLGFIIARLLLTRFMPSAKEAGYAS